MPGAWFRGKPVADEEPLKLVTDRPEPVKPASIEPTEPTLMGGHMETRLMELFHKLDVNGDGMVDASEMEAVLASLGYHSDPSPAAGIIAHMDPAGDGLVNWDTFKRVRSMHESDEPAAEEAEETGEAKDAGPTPRQLLRALVQFMTMDHSGTGLLTEDAMRTILFFHHAQRGAVLEDKLREFYRRLHDGRTAAAADEAEMAGLHDWGGVSFSEYVAIIQAMAPHMEQHVSVPNSAVSSKRSNSLLELPKLMLLEESPAGSACSQAEAAYPEVQMPQLSLSHRTPAPPPTNRTGRPPPRATLRPARNRHAIPLRPLGQDKLAVLTSRTYSLPHMVPTDWWMGSSTLETPRLIKLVKLPEHARLACGARLTMPNARMLKPRAPQPSSWNSDDGWKPKLTPCVGNGRSAAHSRRLCEHRGQSAGLGPHAAWRMKRLYS